MVQNVATSVDKLTERIEKMGRSDGADQLTRKLNKSNQEATLLAKTFERLQTSGKAIGAAVAGWEAGKAVLAPVVHTTMDYQMRLAQATNVSLLGGSIDEKTHGMAKLDAGVMKATRYSGQKREDLLEAAESLIARNSLGNLDDTLKVLPFIGMIAKAGNASSVDVGQATSGLVKSLGVPVDEVKDGLSKILYGGAIGGSEIKHMAHYFPQQSAAAKNAGMSGSSAVAKMVALNELAVDYSGTPDQAGINTTDFLNSMNSSHLANNLKRFSFDKESNTLVANNGQKRTGKNYIDLGHLLAANAEKGTDAVDTMIQIVGMISKGDPKYVEAVKKREVAKQRLEAAKKRGDTGGQLAATEELSGIADNVTAILLGRGIGKLFHNQQELRGGIGVLTNPDAYHDMVKQINDKGTIKMAESEHEFISNQPGYKVQLSEENKADAVYRGMEGFNGWLGKLAEKTSALYEKYPVLAAAMEGGKVGVMTLGASAGAASIVMTLLGKNAAAASAALGGVAAAGGGGGGVGGGGSGGGRLGKFGKVLGAVGAFSAGWEIGSLLNDHVIDPAAKWASGGKSETLGGWIFDATHKEEMARLSGPTPLKKQTFSENVALKRQTDFSLPAPAMDIPPAVGAISNKAVRQALTFNSTVPAIDFPSTGTAAPGAAMQRQMNGPGVNVEAMQRALTDGLKPLPIDAKLKIDVAFDEMNKPYVKQQTVSGQGVRLDTGPMMTH
ncbi:phage-related minor tail family protein [Collimonas pratensis]|uniref:Phage-related minor tail family protein n=1 Tax=Collimonas pratensis TaxID=279113 RepID=A0ABN4M620_9BURK|nr:phage-related minor tail family protein [Collimonas pratensis]